MLAHGDDSLLQSPPRGIDIDLLLFVFFDFNRSSIRFRLGVEGTAPLTSTEHEPAAVANRIASSGSHPSMTSATAKDVDAWLRELKQRRRPDDATKPFFATLSSSKQLR